MEAGPLVAEILEIGMVGMQGGSIWEEEDPQGTKKHNSITIRTMNYSDMSQTEPRHVLMFEKMFKKF